MTILAAIKFGGIGLLAAALFGSGFYFGGLRSKTALEGFQAAQAQLTAKAVLAERTAGATELARVNAILKGYEDEALNPVVVGLAQRVLINACPASSPMSGSGGNPSSAVSAPPQPRGDPEAQRLLQGVFDACEADAAELTALQAAWPR